MTKCDVCNRPTDEVDVQPYMARTDYGYEERVGTCNCDSCPVCGYIHRNWCKPPQQYNNDERAPTCSSCGGNSPEEFCGYCEEKGYHNPDDDRERCADCGYKHDGKCRVDLGRYIQPPLVMKSQIHKVHVESKPVIIPATDKSSKVKIIDSYEAHHKPISDISSREAMKKAERALDDRLRIKRKNIEELELDEQLLSLRLRLKLSENDGN
ncbi:hypothetical protein LCGC14_0677050 [marine sediment metagenome]|uniref:Uncharacterized protein n=1 Tax=marine sediment metagenome TaxID=412755 RepID=A0A0F9TAN5_9ZZZZ